MPFKRFVQTGRIVYITDGPYKGKTAAIVDCVDQKSVLVDGPETNVPRQKLRLNQLHLTKFRINFPFNGPTRVVRKAWKTDEIDAKWAKSRWAERASNKQTRAELTDFDRFKLKRARSIRNKIRTEEYQKLLKRVYNPIRKSLQKKRVKKRALLKSRKTKGKTAAASKGKKAVKK
ncbi:large ribosomal subunit protein eL14 [Planococcus citri]|uniref:large ribosomal subunit protein eL14 n=1 Tax=Planococcus citri TaxID=170843 RepID=UPI0031F95F50